MLSLLNSILLLIAIITSAAWVIMGCIGYIMLGSDSAAALICLTFIAGGVVLIPFSILVYMLVSNSVIPTFSTLRIQQKA